MTENKFTSYQVIHLSLMCSFGMAAGAAPSDLVVFAKKDVWLVFLASIPFNILICLMYSRCIKIMKGKTLHHFVHDVFGDLFGLFINISFFIFLFFSGCLIPRFMGNLISVEMFHTTPMIVLLAPFIIVSFYAAYRGLGAIVRSSEVLVVIMMVIYIMGFINICPKSVLSNALPPFESDIASDIKALKSFLSYTGLTLVSFLFFSTPEMAKMKKLQRSMIIGTLVSTSLSFMISFFPVLIFGHELSALHYFPGYLLASEGSLGDVIDRTDAVIIILYFVGVFMSTTIYSFCTLEVGTFIFKPKNKVTFTIILTVLTLLLAQWKGLNVLFMYNFLKEKWFYIVFVFAVILPLWVSFRKTSNLYSSK